MSGLTAVEDVAAGEAHSIAVTASGQAWVWGDNTYDQLGLGASAPSSLVPVLSSLENVSLVAAGQYHTMVMLADGTVLTWGANSAGQLGTSNTLASAEPAAISEANFSWFSGTPSFDPPAGTYEEELAVVVESLTPDATIHYTTNGLEPTLADPSVPSGGTVAVVGPTTLKAKAFSPGYSPSRTSEATYRFRVAEPTFLPASGNVPLGPGDHHRFLDERRRDSLHDGLHGAAWRVSSLHRTFPRRGHDDGAGESLPERLGGLHDRLRRLRDRVKVGFG